MSAVPADFGHDQCRALQMLLNEKTGSALYADGDFGPKSIAQLKVLQAKCSVPVTGEWDAKLDAQFGTQLRTKYIQDDHIQAAALRLRVTPAHVRAALTVEAAGDGFLPDGRVLILFERHKFYKALCDSPKYGPSKAKEIQNVHPTICNPEAGGYAGKAGEYPRLNVAQSIDYELANASASWGLFQIMGFNHQACGFASALEFSQAMQVSEQAQLDAFVAFVEADVNLARALRANDWATYARLYNGPSYAKNNYDGKLAKAFAQWKLFYRL